MPDKSIITKHSDLSKLLTQCVFYLLSIKVKFSEQVKLEACEILTLFSETKNWRRDTNCCIRWWIFKNPIKNVYAMSVTPQNIFLKTFKSKVEEFMEF